MQRLIDGVHRFRREEFGGYRELFRRLSTDGQNPHTLFITCSDSRVLAELITHSQPGELFVVKNVGNIVPPSSEAAVNHSTAAAIEFAVGVLGVADVVVCGHSQCGAMGALLEPLPALASMPHLREWLSLAAPVERTIRERYAHLTTKEARDSAAAQENVLFAIENLRTYPALQARLASGALHLHAWFFQIASAELFAYDPDSRQFSPLVPP